MVVSWRPHGAEGGGVRKVFGLLGGQAKAYSPAGQRLGKQRVDHGEPGETRVGNDEDVSASLTPCGPSAGFQWAQVPVAGDRFPRLRVRPWVLYSLTGGAYCVEWGLFLAPCPFLELHLVISGV